MSKRLYKLATPRQQLVVVGLLAALVSLGFGLYLPMVRVDKFWIFTDKISLLRATQGLFQTNDYFMGSIVALFSIIFPLTKITLCLWIWWFADITRPALPRAIHLLEITGKWSMLDVFIVALLLMSLKTSIVATASVQPGIFFFTGAVITTMVCAYYLKKILQDHNKPHA